jgi:hypothetical protein
MPKKLEAISLSQPITTKLNDLDYAALVAQAEKENVPKTALVRFAIRHYLNAQKRETALAG